MSGGFIHLTIKGSAPFSRKSRAHSLSTDRLAIPAKPWIVRVIVTKNRLKYVSTDRLAIPAKPWIVRVIIRFIIRFIRGLREPHSYFRSNQDFKISRFQDFKISRLSRFQDFKISRLSRFNT